MPPPSPRASHRAAASLGPIDIVVNCAGVSIPVDIGNDAYEEAWERTIAINLTAYARVIRATVDDLARDGDGADRQHRVDRRTRCDGVHLALHRQQARRAWG